AATDRGGARRTTRTADHELQAVRRRYQEGGLRGRPDGLPALRRTSGVAAIARRAEAGDGVPAIARRAEAGDGVAADRSRGGGRRWRRGDRSTGGGRR